MAEANGSGYQAIEVRSNGMNLFGSDGNLLIISYLDDGIIISICPPYEDGTGKRTYPKDIRIPIVMRRDVVQDLSFVIEKDIIPAYQSGNDFSYGVFLSQKKDSLLLIEGKSGNLLLSYFKDIDENRRPKERYHFQFQSTTCIEKYSPDTGDFELEEIQAQFFCFAHMILNFESICLTKILAHGQKMGNAWTSAQEMNYLRAIASKIGATVEGVSSYQIKPNQNYATNQNNVTHSGNDYTSAQMQDVQDLSGLMT